MRGGSWNNNNTVNFRASNRNNNNPENRNNNNGFRCAAALPSAVGALEFVRPRSYGACIGESI